MTDSRTPVAGDSAIFVLPGRDWRKLHERPARSALLLIAAVLATIAGLLGAVRRVGEFRHLDFETVRSPDGFLVVGVEPRSGAARAGLAWGDVVTAVESVPAIQVDDLERELFARRVSSLSLVRDGKAREIVYYPPSPRVDVRYLLVAFAAMTTLVVAGFVYLGHPSDHAGRFLSLAVALFLSIVIPFPQTPDSSWQVLLLLRDFGRLALPPLLVLFFARFPVAIEAKRWLSLVFLPSVLVGMGRVALTVGWLPPVFGGVLLPEALDTATAVLAVFGVVGAAALGVRSYFRTRQDPTRRRQVEWVALSAAAGFTPYMLLTFIPQLAGARLEVLAWVSLLPLALVPLGVASSLLEFRLWDLEDITRQVIATGVVVLAGGAAFAVLNYAVTQFGFRLGNWRNLVAVAGGVLLATLMLPARRWLLEGVERLQYRERLAARRALTTFAEEAVAHRDPEELLARLAGLLRDALGVDKVVTYLALGDRLYPANATEGWPPLTPAGLMGSFPSSEEAPLRHAGLWHRFPLERDGRAIGVVYCGRRRGELPLGHGERRLVNALAAQASLALENSLLLANLRKQVEEHRLLEDYLERIFQFSAAALLICDASGRVLRANMRAANLLGRTTDQLTGAFLHDLVELRPEWRSYLPSGLSGVHVDFSVDGAKRHGMLSTSTLEVEPGRFDGRVVALDDISDQLQLEQRLAEQERLAALGRLAAGLAHEVNTPVTGISSYAQLLRELTPASDPRAPLVEKVEEQSFRVARIVTNLLELARPSGFERQLVNLTEVARDELMQMRSEADRKGVTISLTAPDEVTVLSNRVQLELVVHNLARNALQATPVHGDLVLEVGRADNGNVWLEVRDSGPGVPAELGDQIFEPFVTTKQGRGGTGVGLAITRDIVRAHGGSIHVLPNQPTGTTMRVELPTKAEGV
jgi:two-component system NtrC family sensor kinase